MRVAVGQELPRATSKVAEFKAASLGVGTPGFLAERYVGLTESRNRTIWLDHLTRIEFVTIINKSMALTARFRLSNLIAPVLIGKCRVRSDRSTEDRHSLRGRISD